ncbi:hypothetical protein ACFYUK_12820 [Nonomuraea wenchangensis]
MAGDDAQSVNSAMVVAVEEYIARRWPSARSGAAPADHCLRG